MITKQRLAFKPFQYQWAYDYWFKQHNAHWLHTEIAMDDDVTDWNENLKKEEKKVIGDILKGFTQTECEVGDYWSSYVPNWFPVPEVKMMGQTFGAFETIHAVAYSYLNDTLGLDDFEAFLEDEATMAKLQVLWDVDPSTTDIKQIATSIALFSAAAEGIQLFSSFAVLLSFKMNKGLMNKMGKQMEFSIRDESLHSEAGCKLFRTLCEENDGLLDSVKDTVSEGIHLALENEFKYIDWIFENGDLESISKAQLKNFMYDRANRKLAELGINDIAYSVDQTLLEEMSWFYIAMSGEQQTDFFANRESGYSKPNSDWNEGNLFAFN